MKTQVILLLLSFWFSNKCFADELKVEAAAERCIDRVFEKDGFVWSEMMISFEAYLVAQGYLEEGDTDTYKWYYKILSDYPYKKEMPPAQSNDKNLQLIRKLKVIGYLKEFRIDYNLFYDCYETAGLGSENKAESDVAVAGMAFKKVKDKEKVNKALLASMLLSAISEDDLKKTIVKKAVVLAFYGDLLCADYHSEATQKNVEQDSVYDKADVMPEFPGGLQGLYEFLAKNVKYPPEAKEKGQEGIVYVNFVIDRDGSIGTVKILKGKYELLNTEAVRVINAMPYWNPGKMRDRNIKVRFTIPITFSLGKELPQKKK
jgi:TonB family protein